MLSRLAKRRLTKLIEFMESLPKSANKHFDMGTWCAHLGDEDHSHLHAGDVVKEEHLHACGTTACAAGWASTMPYFRRLGLKMVWNATEGCAAMKFKNKTDFMLDNLEKAFAISPSQACELFGANNVDKTPKDWARRALRLMRRWA